MAGKDSLGVTLTPSQMTDEVYAAVKNSKNRSKFIAECVSFYLEHKEVPEDLLRNKLDFMQDGIEAILRQMEGVGTINHSSQVREIIKEVPVEVVKEVEVIKEVEVVREIVKEAPTYIKEEVVQIEEMPTTYESVGPAFTSEPIRRSPFGGTAPSNTQTQPQVTRYQEDEVDLGDWG